MAEWALGCRPRLNFEGLLLLLITTILAQPTLVIGTVATHLEPRVSSEIFGIRHEVQQHNPASPAPHVGVCGTVLAEYDHFVALAVNGHLHRRLFLAANTKCGLLFREMSEFL